MKAYLFIVLLYLTSCSFEEKKSLDYELLSSNTERDYVDHLAFTGANYLSNDEIREVKLSIESKQFLDRVYERIVSNNELMFTNKFKPSFHIIRAQVPFIFSLPHSQFYLSSGLAEKYLKSEELFIAALAGEILKSDRNIYEKRIMIPLGFYSTEKMIQITRLKPETKYKLNEWTYVILKRAGHDPSAFLNWIQVQNRNALDFSLFLGDAFGISKEEHFFKNFMTKQGFAGVEKKVIEANSSKEFYKLLTNITSTKK